MGSLLELLMKYLPKIISMIQNQGVKILSKPDPATPTSSFTLTRKQFRSDGIFSELTDQNGNLIAHTLEHAYPTAIEGQFLPKIPNGTFKCVRGAHRLDGMTEDFITFEITGVPGHTNILFHWGNYNKDSEGCVLMGKSEIMNQGFEMITNSRDTWQAFMDSLAGVNEFYLTVT